MKISFINNNKKGYISLEIMVMSCIGFTLVLALLSIAFNKKVLIKNEIKIYENKLKENENKNEFLNSIMTQINNKQIENIFNDEILIDNKLNLIGAQNERFKLYLDEDMDIFILEETLGKNNIKNYYYDYKVINEFMYLKERKIYDK